MFVTKFRILLLVVAITLGLSACATEPEVVVETVEVPVTAVVAPTALPANLPEGTITVGIPTSITTLDPVMAGQVYMLNCGFTAYEGLTYLNANGEVEPLLAKSWDILDDTTFVFHLQEGVKFHNGEPFNADAVIFTWNRVLEPDRINPNSWTTIENIEKIDDYTVKITTKAPDPLFLKRMGVNMGFIYPPEYVTEVGDDGVSQAPVGTSPFKFKEWVRDEKVVFEAWPEYWGGPDKAQVQTVVWRTIPEAGARVAALETGEIDIAIQVPSSMLDVIIDNDALHISRALGTRVFYLMFDNVGSGIGTPLEDKRVRLAIIHAIDRQAIVDAVLRGNGNVLATQVGPTQFAWDPSIEPLPYDPDKARELLTEAGYSDGFEISMACPSGAYPNGVEACQAIEGYLKAVGVDVTLNVREAGMHWDMWPKHELDPLVFDGSGDRYGDPSMAVSILKFPYVWNLWANDYFNELLVAGESTVDQNERKEIYYELQKALMEDPPCVPLWQVYNFAGVNNRVTGFVMQPTEAMDFLGVGVSE